MTRRKRRRALSEFKMVASFVAPPRSLPKLRFGETYRIRARVVDLAGNSLSYDAPNPVRLFHGHRSASLPSL